MRQSHTQAPFHRIECWNGAYFRPASLWEVGTYLVIQHHDIPQEGLCDSLQFQKRFLDSQHTRKDEEELGRLRKERSMRGLGSESRQRSGPGPSEPAPRSGPDLLPQSRPVTPVALDDIEMEDETRTLGDDMQHLDSWMDDTHADAAFESSLNNWLNSSNQDDIMDMDIDSDIGATDTQCCGIFRTFKGVTILHQS